MRTEQQMVYEFHKLFGHEIGDKPKKLTKSERVFRARLMREEVKEFVEAKDSVGQMDALGDLIYFALGCAVQAGIDLEPIFHTIHKCNMNKLHTNPDSSKFVKYREDGKVLKPDGWVGPEEEIKNIIKAQCGCKDCKC